MEYCRIACCVGSVNLETIYLDAILEVNPNGEYTIINPEWHMGWDNLLDIVYLGKHSSIDYKIRRHLIDPKHTLRITIEAVATYHISKDGEAVISNPEYFLLNEDSRIELNVIHDESIDKNEHYCFNDNHPDLIGADGSWENDGGFVEYTNDEDGYYETHAPEWVAFKEEELLLIELQNKKKQIYKRKTQEDITYFNFPIQLLDGFLINKDATLSKIRDYAVYAYCLKTGSMDEQGGLIACESYFNVPITSISNIWQNGKNLYDSYPKNSPMTGLNTSVFLNYFEKNKTDFENVCLLGHLAIKSILMDKSYCKITNGFWLSRMDGKPNLTENVSTEIIAYSKEYQTRKIKETLRNEWGLTYYARGTRGFYVSFKLNLENLIYEVERNRKANQTKIAKGAEKLAIEKAMLRLDEKS